MGERGHRCRRDETSGSRSVPDNFRDITGSYLFGLFVAARLLLHLCLIFTSGYLIEGADGGGGGGECGFLLPLQQYLQTPSHGGQVCGGETSYKSGSGHPGYKSPLMKFLLKDTDGYNPLGPITFNGAHISAAVAPRLTSPCGRSCRIPEASVDARQTPLPPSAAARSMTIDVKSNPHVFVCFFFFFPSRKARRNSEVEH